MTVFLQSLSSARGHFRRARIFIVLAAVCTMLSMVTVYITSLTQQYRNAIVAESGLEITILGTEETYEALCALDWESLRFVSGFETETMGEYSLSVYPDTAAHSDKVQEEMAEMLEAVGIEVMLIDSVETGAKGFSGVATLLFDIADSMLWGTVALSAFILTMISFLWAGDHARDMVIYQALGFPKHNILRQFILETGILVATPVCCMGILGVVLMNRLGSRVVLLIRDVLGYSNYDMMQEMDTELLQGRLSVASAAGVCALILGVLILLAVVFGVWMLRRPWRKLMD